MKLARLFKFLISFSTIASLIVFTYVTAKIKKAGIYKYSKIEFSEGQICLRSASISRLNITADAVDVCLCPLSGQEVFLKNGGIEYTRGTNNATPNNRETRNIHFVHVNVKIISTDMNINLNDVNGDLTNLQTGPIQGNNENLTFTAHQGSYVEGIAEFKGPSVLHKEFTFNASKATCSKSSLICDVDDVTVHSEKDSLLSAAFISIQKDKESILFNTKEVKIGHEKLSLILPSIDKLGGKLVKTEEGIRVDVGSSITLNFNRSLSNFDLKVSGTCQNVLNDIVGLWDAPFRMAGGVNIHAIYNGILYLDGDYNCSAIDPPAEYRRETLRSNFSRIAYDETKKPLEIKSGPTEDDWVSLQDLPDRCAKTFVFSEDGRFYSHRGIDIKAFTAAMNENLRANKWKRGGSTISMQTAKNLWLNRDKTLSRKIAEFFLTMHLESILTKDEILETYLNIAEMAPGAYGIKLAADYHFDETVLGLTEEQCALLTSVLPNPKYKLFTEEGLPNTHKMRHAESIIKRLDKYAPRNLE